MPIYLHSPGEGPEVVYLQHWSIREFENGNRFFVGFSRESRDGRVSTAIVELDAAAHRGRTASGRIYQLVGLSGFNSDAEYVFNRVARILGNGGAWRNVTAELIPDCRVRRPDDIEGLSLEAAARILFVSRTYVNKLIDEGKLPARINEEGIRRIPNLAVKAYREEMRAKQKAGLEAMMDKSEWMGLYDAETEDLPARRKIDEDDKEQ